MMLDKVYALLLSTAPKLTQDNRIAYYLTLPRIISLHVTTIPLTEAMTVNLNLPTACIVDPHLRAYYRQYRQFPFLCVEIQGVQLKSGPLTKP
jgi:hypothetical protein